LSAGPQTSLRVLLIAGEASGDLHGAAFLRALRELVPGVYAQGIGGARLRAAGLECLFPAEALSIMGLPSWRDLRTVWAAFRKVLKILRNSPPALLVLIDFPDFNLWLARFAKRYGVPVFYYISPQVWAWRRRRVQTIKKVVDTMAVVLPFEVEFYARHGIEVHYVGHPLLDVVKPALSRETFCKLAGLDPSRPLMGFFPGSRPKEISSLLPLFEETLNLLKRTHPALQGVFVQAESIPELPLKSTQAKIVKGYQYEVMAQAEAVLLASGTVTLEAAIVGTPMVVAYKMGRFSFWLAKRLVKVPYVSLVNLVANDALVPELLQKEATPENLASHLSRYLDDPLYARRIRERLAEVKKKLGPPGAAWRAAELAARYLKGRGQAIAIT